MPKTNKITFNVNDLQRLNDKQFMHVIYTIFNTIRLCCKQCRTNGGEQVGSNWLPSDFSELVQLVPDIEITALNPVAHACTILQSTGNYPTATWNI